VKQRHLVLAGSPSETLPFMVFRGMAVAEMLSGKASA
jgi:hypothetical protein